MSYQVTLQPSQHQFSVEPDQSVLDAALAAGILLPYSCRSGACSTCKARVVSGTCDAGPTVAQVLAPREIADGYTLLCQARATSDLVVESREVRLASDIQVRKLPAGQYVEVILKNGKRRSYSMANAPHLAGKLELHVRHLPGGLFTDHVFGAGETAMKEREILRLEGPHGTFFLREDSKKPIILLASGTGFAPIKAIVEHIQHLQIARPVTLYWGGRRPVDLYMDGLAHEWAATMPDFSYVPVVSDALPEDAWSGRTGFVHQAVMQDFPDLSAHQVYACGVPIMVESARRDFVTKSGLPEDSFFADSFTSEADTVAAPG